VVEGENMFDDIEDLIDSIEFVSCKKSRISLQDFLKVYVEVSNSGGNSIDVAKKLGITPQGVRQRAGKLIAKGAKLPKLGNICRKESRMILDNRKD
jgi:predicted transcriptional regulator